MFRVKCPFNNFELKTISKKNKHLLIKSIKKLNDQWIEIIAVVITTNPHFRTNTWNAVVYPQHTQRYHEPKCWKQCREVSEAPTLSVGAAGCLRVFPVGLLVPRSDGRRTTRDGYRLTRRNGYRLTCRDCNRLVSLKPRQRYIGARDYHWLIPRQSANGNG